jgi:hypothetical protein
MKEQRIGFQIYDDIPRPSPELIEKLRKFSPLSFATEKLFTVQWIITLSRWLPQKR